MIDAAFKERIDNVNNALSWSDIMPTITERGTITCPFCHRKNKGYLYPNFFKCFSSHCGVQGDKINIYKELKHLSYSEALRTLEGENNLDYKVQQNEFDRRNELLSEVLEAYVDQLELSEPVLEYLYNRGFQYDFIKQNQIGYAPNNTCLKKYGINSNILRRHGLINKYGDFFSKRIIFPVYNINGYLVHLTGRDFTGENQDYKYLDSSAIPIIGSCKDYLLFEKMLPYYKNGSKTLYLVEGVPDSYILRQCGINVVGLMGLQKILNQASKLNQFDIIISVFDNDRFDYNHPNFPGQLKSWRMVTNQLIDLQIYLGEKTQIKTAMIPEGYYLKDKPVKDINDLYLYLNQDGIETKRFIDEHANDLIEDYIDKHKGDFSYHMTALKLISATNRGKYKLDKYIPKDLSPLNYALKIIK